MLSVALPQLLGSSDDMFRQVIAFFGMRWHVGDMESNRMTQLFLRWADADRKGEGVSGRHG